MLSLSCAAFWLQMTLSVEVVGIKQGGMLPSLHTCEGNNTIPALHWSAGPSQTQSYALILEDPDAPGDTFTHFIAYNLSQSSLSQGMVWKEVGYNDFGKLGYAGPCPPLNDKPHRYYVRVYALDRKLSFARPPTREEFYQSLRRHVLAEGHTFVCYQRVRK
ncbi:MAG: YbhB/YbcL family Raf kinase inhibitor-like protein [Bacteroidia bacterium]